MAAASPELKGHCAFCKRLPHNTTGTNGSQARIRASAMWSLSTAEVARCKPLVEAQAGQSVRWTSIGGNAGYLNLNRQIQVRSVVMQVDANTVHCCG